MSGGLMDVRQVAERLNISPRTVYVLAETGRLDHYKIGRLLRFDEEHISAFLAACRTTGEVRW